MAYWSSSFAENDWISGKGVFLWENSHRREFHIAITCCLHDDWVISYLVIWRYTSCWWNKREIQHNACATRCSLLADRFHTEKCGRFLFTWYRCEISCLSEILAPVQQPGWTHAGLSCKQMYVEPWEGTGVDSCRRQSRSGVMLTPL